MSETEEKVAFRAAVEIIADSIDMTSDGVEGNIEDYKALALAYATLMLEAHEHIARISSGDIEQWPFGMMEYRAMIVGRLYPQLEIPLKAKEEINGKEQAEENGADSP